MIGHVAWIDAAAGVASSRELAGIASILRWSMRKAPDDVSTRKGTASEPTDPMPSGRSIRVRTTSRAHAVCSARDWKPRTMRRQRGASARSTVRVVIVVIAISESQRKICRFIG